MTPSRHWSFRAFRLIRSLTGNVAAMFVVVPSAAFGTVMLWDGLPGTPGAARLHAAVSPTPDDQEGGRFASCRDGAADCVIDGRTFRYRGELVRLADIEVPQVAAATCAEELQAGEQAKARLGRLLSADGFTLVPSATNEDGEGNLLRLATRDDHSLGAALVLEGLADPVGEARNWCS
jgi:endonuclease YncB( thermonuclease family)